MVNNIYLNGSRENSDLGLNRKVQSPNYPDSSTVDRFQSSLKRPSFSPLAAEGSPNATGRVRLEPGDYQRLVSLSEEDVASLSNLDYHKWVLASNIRSMSMNWFQHGIKIADTSNQ